MHVLRSVEELDQVSARWQGVFMENVSGGFHQKQLFLLGINILYPVLKVKVKVTHVHLELEIVFIKNILTGLTLLTLEKKNHEVTEVILGVKNLDIHSIKDEATGQDLEYDNTALW